MVNLTQINFNRPPEEQIGEMYRLLERIVEQVNDSVIPELNNLTGRVAENEGSIESITRNISEEA